MIKLIRDNQKKVVAGIAVISMITFVYTGRTGNSRGDREDRELGSVAHGPRVMASEVKAAQTELQAVRQFTAQPMYGPGSPAISLVDRLIGRAGAEAVLSKPELFVLLRRQAVAAGVTADPATVQQFVDASLTEAATSGVDVPSPQTDPYDAFKAGVADLLTVSGHFGQVAAALKVSGPAVEHQLSMAGQTIQLNVVPVPVDGMSAKIPLPTSAQMQEQFNRFADVAPDHADPVTDPLGFGYRSPVKVQVQYLRVAKASIEKAVVDGKTPDEWALAGARLYYADPSKFVDPVAPPNTPPPPLAAVRDEAVKRVRDPLVAALQDEVERYLSARLTQDYPAYVATPAGGSPRYDSLDYLKSLAAGAAAKFKVQVAADQLAPMTLKELSEYPGLKSATASGATATSATAGQTLPAYVMGRTTAYLDHPSPAAVASELMQPSPAFHERGLDAYRPGASAADAVEAVDFARVSAVTPAAPAPNVDAVRLAVDADYHTAAAYDLAKAQAEKLVEANKAGKLIEAVLASQPKLAMIPTQPLKPTDTTIDNLQPPLNDGVATFIKQAFGLLGQYDPKTNPHPAAVIAMPAQRRVFVVQLVTVNATWSGGNFYQAELESAAQLQSEQVQMALQGWFSPAAIAARAGYKPVDAQQLAQ